MTLTDPETSPSSAEGARLPRASVSAFAHAAIVVEIGARLRARKLYGDYRAWACMAGAQPVSEKAFALELKALGYRTMRSNGMVYLDVQQREPVHHDPQPVVGAFAKTTASTEDTLAPVLRKLRRAQLMLADAALRLDAERQRRDRIARLTR